MECKYTYTSGVKPPKNYVDFIYKLHTCKFNKGEFICKRDLFLSTQGSERKTNKRIRACKIENGTNIIK